LRKYIPVSEQIGLLPERANERGWALHKAHVTPDTVGKIAHIHDAVIGHGVVFEVSPGE
jgi:hypothetical protein